MIKRSGVPQHPSSDPRWRRLNSAYLEEYSVLHENGVRTVEVFEKESLASEFVIVRKEDVKFTLARFLKGGVDLSPQDKQTLLSELVEFAKTTARFDRIEDFKPANIAWVGNKWILLDWDGGAELALEGSKKTTFDIWNARFDREGFLEEVKKGILEQRKMIFSKSHHDSKAESCGSVSTDGEVLSPGTRRLTEDCKGLDNQNDRN